jgi:hypothetical protein
MTITCNGCHYSAEAEVPWQECPRCRSRLYTVSRSGRLCVPSGTVTSRSSGSALAAVSAILLVLVVAGGGVALWFMTSPRTPVLVSVQPARTSESARVRPPIPSLQQQEPSSSKRVHANERRRLIEIPEEGGSDVLKEQRAPERLIHPEKMIDAKGLGEPS